VSPSRWDPVRALNLNGERVAVTVRVDRFLADRIRDACVALEGTLPGFTFQAFTERAWWAELRRLEKIHGSFPPRTFELPRGPRPRPRQDGGE